MAFFIENLDNYIEKWRNLQEASYTFSYFQSQECFEFYSSLYFMRPFAYGVEENGELKAVIVGYVTYDKNPAKQFLTRRAVINAGPMLADDVSEKALALLLSETQKRLKKQAIYIETRNFFDYSAYKPVFERAGFKYEKHLNFKVDTTTIDIVDANVSKNIKRDVKTSVRDGAVIVEKPSPEQVSQYYDLLSDLYKTKVKTPLFPKEFFTKLADFPSTHYLLVDFNGKIIGGTVCVGFGGKMYEWFVCGEDRLIKHVFPSLLATYSALRYCAENGFSVFDMMGAGKPDEGYGVRDFKARFGGKLVEEGRFVHIAHPLLYKIGKWGVKLLKKI